MATDDDRILDFEMGEGSGEGRTPFTTPMRYTTS